jgi:hypothetical protein
MLANYLYPSVVGASALTALAISGIYLVVKDQQRFATRAAAEIAKTASLALVVSLLALSALPTLAQESTAVPLEIPTGVIFSETNNWLETFAPIAAIGIGITIALAVLGYLGKMIVSAFKG